MLVLVLLPAVVAVTLSMQAPAQDVASSEVDAGSVELPAELEPSLAKLARRFGVDNWQMSLMSGMLGILAMGTPSYAKVQESIAQVEAALATSNAPFDLAAPPVPTGDSLFDRYALEVEARIAELEDGGEVMQIRTCAALHDELLAGWENEFGDDARYWELRYLCAWSNAEKDNFSSNDFTAPADILREARRRGVTTANTLLILSRELREEYEARFEELPDPRSNPEFKLWGWKVNVEMSPRKVLDPEVVEQLLNLHKSYETEELELLNEAMVIGPDEAWPYYLRALYWFELGEHDLAIADLEAGNAAPVNVYPRPFPVPFVVEALTAKAPAGSAAVSGAILLLQLSYPLLKYLRLREFLKDSLVAVNLSGDPATLEAWHQFACRYSACLTDSYVPSLAGLVLYGMVRKYTTEEQATALNNEQRETLMRMLGAQEAVKGAMDPLVGYEGVGSTIVLGMAGGARGIAVSMYIANAYVRSVFLNDMLPIIREMSEVHYPALEMPQSLLKYEAVTMEELKRRRLEKRARKKEEAGQD
ncbi:hypothetical protein IIA79_08515 [bacterium]|nr:hypothetical protein [bacterium]